MAKIIMINCKTINRIVKGLELQMIRDLEAGKAFKCPDNILYTDNRWGAFLDGLHEQGYNLKEEAFKGINGIWYTDVRKTPEATKEMLKAQLLAGEVIEKPEHLSNLDFMTFIDELANVHEMELVEDFGMYEWLNTYRLAEIAQQDEAA